MVKHLIITGRVQGIGYRYFMNRIAAELGVTGWVRNRGDGTVEAVVSGSDEATAEIIEWAQHGPPDAVVDHVEIADTDGTFFENFVILPTE